MAGSKPTIDVEALIAYDIKNPGTKMSELAEMLGCSIGTISYHLGKAGRGRIRGHGAQNACVVCGKSFKPKWNYDKMTCSPECLKILIKRSKIDYSKLWPLERRKGMSKRMKKAAKESVDVQDVLRKGRDAWRKDPRASATEENLHAKYWVVKAPDGRIYSFRNLALFSRQAEANYGVSATGLCDAMRKQKMQHIRDPLRQWTEYKGWILVEWGD